MTRDEFLEEVGCRAEVRGLSVDFGDAEGMLRIAADLFAEVTKCQACGGVGQWQQIANGIQSKDLCGDCNGTGSRLR